MLEVKEPGGGPNSGGGVGDMMGNRKLIALGAVLGWLLVVHLLVNVWLLCILSGLLALLGGWLGSQVVINTSHKIHLERFLLLESLPQSPEAEKQLDEEIENMIRKIVRDFVSSWYRAVSTERGFEDEVERAMLGLAVELKRRMTLVDKQALTQKVLLLGGCHLQIYKKAREKVTDTGISRDSTDWADRLWHTYRELWEPHAAVQNPTSEVDYARHIVDLLLRVLVPKPHLETRTGHFVVVELVTCNVLLPMINKMADPDWLNLLLIAVFSKIGGKRASTIEKVETVPAVPALLLGQPVVPDSLPLASQWDAALEAQALSPRSSEPLISDVMDGLEIHVSEGREPISRELSAEMDRRRISSVCAPCLQADTLGSFFPCEDLEIESPMSDLGKDSGPIGLMSAEEFLASSLSVEVSDSLDQEDNLGIRTRFMEDHTGSGSETGLQATSLSPCPDIQIEPAVEKETALASLSALLENPEKTFLRRPSSLEKELVASECLPHNPQDLAQLPGLLSSSPTASMGTFSFEPLSSPDGPIIIQNLRITGTITAREHSGTGDNTSTLQQVAYHTVNRRYREFLNLQTRLEEKPDLRKFIKS
ncbi:hypothetical protein JD844_031382 [Phrynosoma platyrhinos]|uniref:PXA domain-containing protein n=1 Tax=Phrynosoma platyrhinos TaxID=52577 RepID=A0ABQ7T184_PHRPL|nr:hypothetical protein JD844_031382 [Phrynosoma platyrhinos]